MTNASSYQSLPLKPVNDPESQWESDSSSIPRQHQGIKEMSDSTTNLISFNIAIVTRDISGPYHCGGVGTAYRGLSMALAGDGHTVTILYCHHDLAQGKSGEWEAFFASHGICFVHLQVPEPRHLWYANRKEISYLVYQWLKIRDQFDVIHFHEWLGLPYYSLLAKNQGLAFQQSLLCVGAHGSMRWSRSGDGNFAAHREDVVVDFMERKSIELADVVVSPSTYLLAWMEKDKWQLPVSSYCQQNIIEFHHPVVASRSHTSPQGIDELVFFGRLDRRKGLAFFCDVIERIQSALNPKISLTFLGAITTINGYPSDRYIKMRMAQCPCSWQIIADYDRDQVITYLQRSGRLAVIPSLIDNSPCTVQECLHYQIPFLASDSGGIPELIATEDRERVTCSLNLEPFAARLLTILAHGHDIAHPAFLPETIRSSWLHWHRNIKDSYPDLFRPLSSLPTNGKSLLVSICIAHFERPALLRRMLSSIAAQSYANLEVIVVDDGSSTPDSTEQLTHIESEYQHRGWRIIRQQNQGPGVARHHAAMEAKGEYLLFLDDDDYLEAHAVETFVKAASHSHADILTCAYQLFDAPGIPSAATPIKKLLLPLGAAFAACVQYPDMGGTIYFVRKSAYFAVGGFTLEPNVDEDWDLLLRLVWQGFTLQVIPEMLLWYQDHPTSRSKTNNRYTRIEQRIRQFEDRLPLELRDFASLAFCRLANIVNIDDEQRLARVRSLLNKSIKTASLGSDQ